MSISNGYVPAQLGLCCTASDPDTTGFCITAVRQFHLPLLDCTDGRTTTIIGGGLHDNLSALKRNYPAVSLQPYCRGAAVFSNIDIYLLTDTIKLISCFSLHLNISRRDRQIMFYLKPVGRCRTGNAGHSLVSAAVLPASGSYRYIACCYAALTFVYRYFSNGSAACSPLHDCR